jgi:hypothetical protein
LLCEPEVRLGKDIDVLKNHPVFCTIDWEHLADIEPPFIPRVCIVNYLYRFILFVIIYLFICLSFNILSYSVLSPSYQVWTIFPTSKILDNSPTPPLLRENSKSLHSTNITIPNYTKKITSRLMGLYFLQSIPKVLWTILLIASHNQVCCFSH